MLRKIKYTLGFFAITFSLLFSSQAQAVPVRVGGAIGFSTWSGSPYVYGSADVFGLFHQRMTVGGDIMIIKSSLLIEPRLLFWEKPDVSGFYGGPKIALGPIGDLSPFIGIGGEFGWVRRLANHFDFGGGLQILISNHDTEAGLQFNAGYLVP